MNSYQRILSRLIGDPVDRPPNFDIFMTFAAHHIRQPLSKYYLDYKVLVDANLAMVDDFEVDILQAISDPYRESADFGAQIEFPEDSLPVCRIPLLVDADNLSNLRKPDPTTSARMLDRLRAIQMMSERSRNEIPVMGWVEGALAQASTLRGMTQVLIDVHDRPGWVGELLEICTSVAIDFARAQVQAGAHIIGLGDAVASQISPRMYRQFVLPYEQRIIQAVHALGALTRLHICGNTTSILPSMVESGADIIDLDWMVDMKTTAALFGDRVSFCGNFDPVAVMLQGTPRQVYLATQKCMRDGGSQCFSAAGCEIPCATPDLNLHQQNLALRDVPCK